MFLLQFQGQIELYTHMPVMRQLVETLHQWDFRVCGVFLIDSQFMVDCSKFFAGVLSALSAMIQLEVPHINVMSKMDLLNKKQLKDVDRWVHILQSAACSSLKSTTEKDFSDDLPGWSELLQCIQLTHSATQCYLFNIHRYMLVRN